jgi:hypothetical protein
MTENLFDLSLEDELLAVAGYRAPAPFLDVLQLLVDDVGDDAEELAAWLEEVAGVRLAGRPLKAVAARSSKRDYVRYPETPPELFPFAKTGVGGVHLGHVVHAPELAAADYPVGELSPSGPSGVSLVGRTTAEAFENLLSRQRALGLAPTLSRAEARRVEDRRARLVRALAIDPQVDRWRRRYDAEGKGLPLIPEVPEGWRHVMTSDGVGVLAPEEAFPGRPVTLPKPGVHFGHFISTAREALMLDWPAQALRCLKEGWWTAGSQEGAIAQLAPMLIETYELLGRRSLADIVESSARRFG